MLESFSDWLAWTPLWLMGLVIFGGLTGSSAIARVYRRRRDRKQDDDAEAPENSGQLLMVSSVMGLLALIVAFTFSMSLERFDTRWENVLEESNAIGTTYLRAQLLEEPHRTQLSKLLVDYTDNRIALATALPGPKQGELLKINDRLIVQMWAETVTAFPSIRTSTFSHSFLESMNNLIDMDAKRKAGRGFHVPSAVFLALFLFQLVAAGLISYVVVGQRSRQTARVLFILFGLLLLLIIDIDRPTSGTITESQEPMLQLQSFLRSQPPGSFDRAKVGM